ncbi:hypothetical protein QFC20_000210 [Naganishia adeliensis]|uniref:Uncharacterized protein n=1 Tax=Naganishia adeliensis TaxID=92952 RepID=A0ACC2X3L5_9TREE|nr:hypothetical protein QFC20_000210 [Naganishia adeliensis]
MPTLHQFDYLFAFGVIFCTLDAYQIGANDVANSWATSVSSKSVTMKQAILGAAIFEFLGAVLVGGRVSSTIKNGIIPADVFKNDAGLQLLGFVNAIFISSLWLTLATYMSWPVSTTYSIVSAVLGVGIAVGGFDAPSWGWNGGKGMAAIWGGLVIAPAMAAGFGAIIFLLVKYIVLKRKDSTRWGLITGPIWFFIVACVLTMSIIYKGSPQLNLEDMSPGKTAAVILLTGLVVGILSVLFWVPYVRAKVIKKDYTIRFYHFFYGPFLWNRPAPADAGEIGKGAVADYRIRDHKEGDVVNDPIKVYGNPDSMAEQATMADQATVTEEAGNDEKAPRKTDSLEGSSDVAHAIPLESKLEKELEVPQHPIEGPWILPKNIWIVLRHRAYPFVHKMLTHGAGVDVHARQAGTGTKDAERMQKIYGRAVQYPNETEHIFSFMQVMTACTASFAHGANDLSNAIGPFSVIYYTWKNGVPAGKESDVEVWMLVYGAATLVLGLATYGYNIMSVLGNRITLVSPSRGFCMELGGAITVILASQYGIPVSTTMCITGATIGVGLCNGDVKSIAWRSIGWIYLGWILTIVVVAIASACLLAIVINAPRLN